MDIITQVLSGICAATGVAALCRCRPTQRVKIVLMGAVGGAFPDLDTMTIWPGFDQTFGTWLGLNQSGTEIYFGQAWYSHQGFFHSLLGFVLFTLLAWLSSSQVYARGFRRAPSVLSAAGYLGPYFVAFALGYGLHLLGDLFTPGGPWGGIRLFFPLDTYIGGWGKVWWWNNYDVALILVLGIIINLFSLFSFSMFSLAGRFTPIAVFVCTLILIGYQFNLRDFNYNHHGYTVREQASLQFQQQHLPHKLYRFMRRIDQKLPVYF